MNSSIVLLLDWNFIITQMRRLIVNDYKNEYDYIMKVMIIVIITIRYVVLGNRK